MHASLEELMKIEITSASRKEQRVETTPAAVFVLTQDDIQRSGMTTLPELLRLAPGVQVAQINATTWAITARGFNGLFANKLLVMIDGRTIYNPLFGGVFWDAEDLAIDDIARIEVVRGAGGAVWGANAVNGIINIITKRAEDATGLAARVRTGSAGTEEGAIRYGAPIGTAHYRVFSQWTSGDIFADATGRRLSDSTRIFTNGARIDWSTLTLDGSFTAARNGGLWLNFNALPTVVAYADATTVGSGHVLGRWTHATRRGGSVQLQSFYDAMTRTEPIGGYHRNTVDVDFESRQPAGRHDFVVGGGYRYIDERFSERSGIGIKPDRETDHLTNAFAQDEIALRADRRLQLTLGAKIEHAAVTGVTTAPTARLMWTAVPGGHYLWTAIARGVRTPTMIDRNLMFQVPYGIDASGLPVLYQVRGNPRTLSETVRSNEAGYRFEFKSTFALDVAAFVASYNHLTTNEPFAPSVQFVPTPEIVVGTSFDNLMGGDTRGVEASARWQPMSSLRVDGSYTTFHLTPHLDPTSHDLRSVLSDGNAPAQQARIHAAWSPLVHFTGDVSVAYSGPLKQLDIPAYSRTDVQLEWRATRSLSLDLIGRNLFDPDHFEFNPAAEFAMTSAVPRSLSVQCKVQIK